MLPGVLQAGVIDGKTTGTLDTQTVTSGADGSAPGQDRRRGYSGVGALGSIVDGLSNIFSNNAIDNLLWDENLGSPQYVLTIQTATDSGWSTMTIQGPNGTKVLTRASRTSFAANTWKWSTADLVGANAFGAAGANVTVNFD